MPGERNLVGKSIFDVVLSGAFGTTLTPRDRRILVDHHFGRTASIGDHLKVGIVALKSVRFALRPGLVARRVERVMKPLDEDERDLVKLRTGATGQVYGLRRIAQATSRTEHELRRAELRAYQKLARL